MLCQRLHHLQRGVQTFRTLVGTQPTEIPGGQNGDEIQAHVGRRGAVRDDGLRRFLEIVRRKPVVTRGDEGFKEAPGSASDQA